MTTVGEDEYGGATTPSPPSGGVRLPLTDSPSTITNYNSNLDMRDGVYSIVTGESVDINCLGEAPVDYRYGSEQYGSDIASFDTSISTDMAIRGLISETSDSEDDSDGYVSQGLESFNDIVERHFDESRTDGGWKLVPKPGVDTTVVPGLLEKASLREIMEGRDWTEDRRITCPNSACCGVSRYCHGVFGFAIPPKDPQPITIEEVRFLAEPLSQKIWQNFHRLKTIIQRYEGILQKRWGKKSKNKRRQLLQLAWSSTSNPPPPPMATKHRPEVQFLRHEKHTVDANEKCNKCGHAFEDDKRHLFMWPRLNLEDLSKFEPLLILLNARGRHSPPNFAFAELEPCHFGVKLNRLTHPPYLNMYSMFFTGQEGPETYGRLVSWLEKPEAYKSLHMGHSTSPGEGLWILEIQDRLYKFLVYMSEALLHDQPVHDITQLLTLPVEPEPPLPTANGRANDNAASLMTTRNEIAYHLPAKLDIRRLQNLVASKKAEAEDTLLALREDPSLFISTLEEIFQSRPEQLQDTKGGCHPFVATPNGKRYFMPHIVRLMWQLYVPAVERWGRLHDMVSRLAELKEHLFDEADPPIRLEDDLPSELSMAIYSLLIHSEHLMESRLRRVYHDAEPSPPLRHLFRREGITDPRLSRHKPLCCADTVRSDHARSTEEENYLWLLSRMSGSSNNEHGFGIHNCVEELESLSDTPAGRALITPLQAAELSDMTIVSECTRQLQLFQPWAATFQAGMAAREVDQKLQEETQKTEVEQRHLSCWAPSNKVCAMGAVMSELTYPAEKRPTEGNISAMCEAEKRLDEFWEAALVELEGSGRITDRLAELLHMRPERTPEWVEPEKKEVKTAERSSGDQLPCPFHGDNGDTQAVPTRFIATEPRTKTKSRGIARLSPLDEPVVTKPTELAAQATEATTFTFEVDKRAMTMVDMLFHKQSLNAAQGDIPWTDFTYMMYHVGFGVEKLMGSAWQFTPGPELVEHGWTRGIQCHEPHPSSKLNFVESRRFGRRLTRTYGWCSESFTMRAS